MLISLVLAITIAAAIPITTHTREGSYDVETTTTDYVDETGCHLHEDHARYTQGSTFVKDVRTIARTCGTRAYTFRSTMTATTKTKSHKEDQATDNDPATCSSLTRSESGDYVRGEEIAGQRTIAMIVNGVARPTQRATIKNGKWVTLRSAASVHKSTNAGSSVCPVTPVAGEDGGYASRAMLPPYAASGSVIAVHVTPGEGGAQGVLVLTEDAQHNKRYERRKPNAVGTLLIDVAVGTALVELVRRIDEHGAPDILSHTTVDSPTHIPGTDVVARPPAGGPSILESTSSAQPGDLLTVHIARNDPQSTRFLLDGRPVTPLGVSNNSAVIQVPSDTSLANHVLVMQSGDKKSEALQIAIVRLSPEPVAPSSPGVVQTVRVHVDGLAPGAQAKMYFDVGGAATMLSGGTSAATAVIGGVATVQIRGTRAGQALLRFHLSVSNPEFVPLP
jgi:hypothetical protein